MPPQLVHGPEPTDAWLEELARRAQRALSGQEPGELWSEVEARLRNDLTA
jgi:hypothetical protein